MTRGSAPVLLASSVLLSACGLLGQNCWECGGSITFHNATDRVVEVISSDERFVSSPKRLEPGEEKSYSSGGIPRRGDLRKLLLTIRATDLSGAVVFCERLSWHEFLLEPGHGTIEITLGDVRC